jgi:hypothetical protein
MISDWKVHIGDDSVGVFPYKRIYSNDRIQSGLVIDGELMANARLIAAAPDLLEALQDLFDADMEHVLMGDGKDDQIEAIAKARAAIAKATGAQL